MAPEQRRGEPVDIRADIYGLGLTLCRLLYPGSEGGAILLTTDDRVGPELVRVLTRMVADAPGDRFAEPFEVVQALAAFAIDHDLRSLAARALDEPPESADARRIDLPARSQPPTAGGEPRLLLATSRRRLPRRASVAIAVGVLLLLIGVFGETVTLIATNQGELRVTVLDDQVKAKVEIQGEHQTIQVIDLKTRDKLTLQAGEYGLRLRTRRRGLSWRLTGSRFAADGAPSWRCGEFLRSIRHRAGTAKAVQSGPPSIFAYTSLDGLDRNQIRPELQFSGQPSELVAAMVTPRGWHPQRPTRLAISPDGRRLASASHDPIVRLWDTATLRYPDELEGHELGSDGQAVVLRTAFSRDGRMLASCGGDSTLRLWANNQGRFLPLRALRGHAAYVMAAAFAPDGTRLFSGAHDETVRVWHLNEPARPPDVLTDNTSYVLSVAVSADGRWLASGGQSGQVCLWDISGAKPEICQSIEAHQGMVNELTFLPDSTSLVTVGGWLHDRTVCIWGLAERRLAERFRLHGHTGWVSALAVHPQRPWIATGANEPKIRLWDLEARRELTNVSLPATVPRYNRPGFQPRRAKFVLDGRRQHDSRLGTADGAGGHLTGNDAVRRRREPRVGLRLYARWPLAGGWSQ